MAMSNRLEPIAMSEDGLCESLFIESWVVGGVFIDIATIDMLPHRVCPKQAGGFFVVAALVSVRHLTHLWKSSLMSALG